MSDTLFRSLDLIEPGDLVVYHGSLTCCHGLYVAVPCDCKTCRYRDQLGGVDLRYKLIDPWGENERSPLHVRRESITRSAASG